MVEATPGGYLRFVAALLKHKILVASAAVVAACGAGLFAAFSPDVYEASVVLMPENRPLQGLGVQLKQAVGELFPGTPISSEAQDFCVDLLHSNRLLDAVIDGVPELPRMWGDTHREGMRKRLLSCCSFEPTRSGMLRISARMKDRQLSARLANALADELQNLYRSIMLDRIHRELAFLDKRLAEAGEELAEAEDRLAEFQRKRKMIRPDQSATATFSAMMSIESRIIEEEARLEVLKSYASLSNPELRLQGERVKALRRSLREIARDGNPSAHEADQVLIPLRKLPEVGLEGVRIERERRLREKLYLFLMERHEGLNLARAKESSALTVIEEAEVPQTSCGPPRLMWVALAAFAGLVLGSSLALVAEHLRALDSTEEGRKALEELKGSVWGGG